MCIRIAVGMLFLMATAGATDVVDVGSKKQVILDGYFLDQQDNITLTMHKPYRDGQILIKPDQPWEMDPAGKEQRLSLYSCVRKEDGRLRVWYGSCRGVGSPEIRVAYAESEDGIHFKKPKLGLHELDGSKENNIVLPGPRIAGAAVWVDPQCPPGASLQDADQSVSPGAAGKVGDAQFAGRHSLESFRRAESRPYRHAKHHFLGTEYRTLPVLHSLLGA